MLFWESCIHTVVVETEVTGNGDNNNSFGSQGIAVISQLVYGLCTGYKSITNVLMSMGQQLAISQKLSPVSYLTIVSTSLIESCKLFSSVSPTSVSLLLGIISSDIKKYFMRALCQCNHMDSSIIIASWTHNLSVELFLLLAQVWKDDKDNDNDVTSNSVSSSKSQAGGGMLVRLILDRIVSTTDAHVTDTDTDTATGAAIAVADKLLLGGGGRVLLSYGMTYHLIRYFVRSGDVKGLDFFRRLARVWGESTFVAKSSSG